VRASSTWPTAPLVGLKLQVAIGPLCALRGAERGEARLNEFALSRRKQGSSPLGSPNDFKHLVDRHSSGYRF
jgi:hypothetical protein